MKKGIEKILLSGIIAGSLGVSGCVSGPNYARIPVSGISSIGLNNDLERINSIVEGNAPIESANQNRLVRSLSSNSGKTYVTKSAYTQDLGNNVQSNANFDKGLYGGGAILIDAVKIGGSYFILKGAARIITGGTSGIGPGGAGGAGGIGPGGAGGAGGAGIIP